MRGRKAMVGEKKRVSQTGTGGRPGGDVMCLPWTRWLSEWRGYASKMMDSAPPLIRSRVLAIGLVGLVFGGIVWMWWSTSWRFPSDHGLSQLVQNPHFPAWECIVETANDKLPGTGQGWEIVTDPSLEFGEFWVATPWQRYRARTVEGRLVFPGGRGGGAFLECP